MDIATDCDRRRSLLDIRFLEQKFLHFVAQYSHCTFIEVLAVLEGADPLIHFHLNLNQIIILL